MNSYALASTAPSRRRVCLFHHLGAWHAQAARRIIVGAHVRRANDAASRYHGERRSVRAALRLRSRHRSWRRARMLGALAVRRAARRAHAVGAAAIGAGRRSRPTSTTSNEQYTLLYSTLGYDSAATKRVLIRQNDVGRQPASRASRSTGAWSTRTGRRRAVGHAAYDGDAWGIPLWIADFSRDRRARRVPHARRVAGRHAGHGRLSASTSSCCSRATFVSVALDNAEARAAPIEIDGGYYDGNSTDGSVAAHARVPGRAARRRSTSGARPMTEASASARGRRSTARIDYLLLLSDPATGRDRRTTPTARRTGDRSVRHAGGARARSHVTRASFRREDSDEGRPRVPARRPGERSG